MDEKTKGPKPSEGVFPWMNDEKTAVINMVSDGVITSSEGVALFEALCHLEGISSHETGVEFEALRDLPPWESEGQRERELAWSLFEHKFAKAITLVNREIVSALREATLEAMEAIPYEVSALDLSRISGFWVRPKRGDPGAFVSGAFALTDEGSGIRQRGWGFLMARLMNGELGQPPTWGERVLMQIFTVPGFLQLEWKAGEVIDEEQEQVRAASTVESFDDSVTTQAGRFDGCLKLKIAIHALGDSQFVEERGVHDLHNDLRMIGTKFVWLAPNVGVVKFLHEHVNNTRTEIELVDYHVRTGEQLYFPLSLGNRWQYQWQDEFGIHRELVRTVLCIRDEVLVSFANHMEEIDWQSDGLSVEHHVE